MQENKQDKKVLLRVKDFKQYFPVKKSSLLEKKQLYVRANDGITVDIYEGETLGMVGESGCGKSTFGRVLLQLYNQTAGTTIYCGKTIYEVAPHYVEDILKNLPKKWEDYKKCREKQQKNAKKEKESIVNEAKELYDVLLSVVGGLLVAESLEEVSKKMLVEYQAGVRYYHLKQKKEKEEEVTKAEEAFHKATREVEELRKKYEKNPEFIEKEKERTLGVCLEKLTKEEMRLLRKDLQMIFQDPYSSLDARMTVGQIIGEGLLTHHFFSKNTKEMQEYITKIMKECGLEPYFFHRYPHQFSGGQRQRIGIARSLALKPKFVICDEAVSALDVSIQSQIINLLLDLKEKESLTYLFISHDLSVVKYISDRIGVMYLGNLVELAPTEELFHHPMHPYTEALLSAIPTTEPETQKEMIILEGDIPSPIKPPKGCKFHTRCRYCTEKCKTEQPQYVEIEKGHYVACHYPL